MHRSQKQSQNYFADPTVALCTARIRALFIEHTKHIKKKKSPLPSGSHNLIQIHRRIMQKEGDQGTMLIENPGREVSQETGLKEGFELGDLAWLEEAEKHEAKSEKGGSVGREIRA